MPASTSGVMRLRSTTRCPLIPLSTRSSRTLTAASLAPRSRNLIWSIASRRICRRDMCPALYIARPKWYALEPAISVRSRSKKAAPANPPSGLPDCGLFIEQLQDALGRPGEHRALAALGDRSLDQIGVLGHQPDQLLVGQIRLREAEVAVHRLFRAHRIARAQARLAQQLSQLVLAQRVDVVVHA